MVEVEDPSKAIALISSYLAASKRLVEYLQVRYPHEDVEIAVMQALYLAAFTFREDGPGTFYFWFRTKVFGQTSGFRRRARLLALGHLSSGRLRPGETRYRFIPMKQVTYSERLIDHRLFYQENTDAQGCNQGDGSECPRF